MPVKYVDNGSGAKLNQTANQSTLTAALVTSTPTSVSNAFGFSTSAKMIAMVSLVNSMRAALIAAGIGK